MRKRQNKKTTKTARLFEKRARARAGAKKKALRRHTKPAPAAEKKQQAKAQITPEIDMHIDGVLYKIRQGRKNIYRILPTSKRYGFELCPTGDIPASEGELVGAVITRLPDRDGVAACRITQVFGAADSRRANYEQILAANEIETFFSEAVIEEAEKTASHTDSYLQLSTGTYHGPPYQLYDL